MFFENFCDVPTREWPFKFFKPHEIACRGTGGLLMHLEALTALDALRESLGGAMRLSSAYRSPYHNANVGGAPRSSHLEGHAFDVRLDDWDKANIRAVAEAVGFTGFGMNYSSFIHIDMGRKREW